MSSFSEIPNTRAPYLFVQIDNSKALSSPTQRYSVLLMGQGLKVVDQVQPKERSVVPINSPKDAAQFGQGSMLEAMVKSFFKGTTGIGFDVYAMPLSMDTSAALPGLSYASGTITFSGTVTQDAPLKLLLGGSPLVIPIPPKDPKKEFKQEDLALLVTATINNAGLPIAAAVNDKNKASIDVVSKHAGVVGNGFDLRTTSLPSGLTCLTTSLSGATGAPVNLLGSKDISSVLGAMGQFHIIAFPYPDKDCLGALRDELNGRWKATEAMDGMAFTAITDSAVLNIPKDILKTYGLNCPYISLIAWNGISTHYEVASSVVAQIADSASKDPSMPFLTLPLPGLIPTNREGRFSLKTRGDLLSGGVSTLKETSNDQIMIDRLITTYTGNGQFLDESYLDVNAPLILSFLRYSFSQTWGMKFSRMKLSKETPRVRTNGNVMYPGLAIAAAVSWYKDMIELGVVQDNIEAFKKSIDVKIIEDGKLEIYIEPEIMGQLVGTGVKMAFIK